MTPPVGTQSPRGRSHHLAVGAAVVGEVLGYSAARKREGIAMQMTPVEQRLEHRIGAAGAVDVDGEIAPARLQVG